ncbi:MAG: hypothetical protein GW949_05770 [Spirochaetales bacterium]|nr:hypothetical protein [Spirochaetales bacterium]
MFWLVVVIYGHFSVELATKLATKLATEKSLFFPDLGIFPQDGFWHLSWSYQHTLHV